MCVCECVYITVQGNESISPHVLVCVYVHVYMCMCVHVHKCIHANLHYWLGKQ